MTFLVDIWDPMGVYFRSDGSFIHTFIDSFTPCRVDCVKTTEYGACVVETYDSRVILRFEALRQLEYLYQWNGGYELELKPFVSGNGYLPACSQSTSEESGPTFVDGEFCDAFQSGPIYRVCRPQSTLKCQPSRKSAKK